MASPLYDLQHIPMADLEALEKFRGGTIPARIELGDRPALLIVDMTEAFVRDRYPTGWAATGVPCATAIADLLREVRGHGLPVIYTRSEALHHPSEVGAWARGRDADNVFPFSVDETVHDLVPEVGPKDDDIVIRKAKPSAFFGTQLVSVLTALRSDSLIVTGMTTSGCVRATVVDGFSLNYGLTIPVECVADRSQVSHEVGLFDMGAKYGDVAYLDQVLKAF